MSASLESKTAGATAQQFLIQPTPDLHGQVDVSFLTGLAPSGEKLVILLDIDKVLTTVEAVAAIEAAGQN